MSLSLGGEKGFKLSHEASIITTKRAEMKMIEFFIARIVVDWIGAGYLTTKRL